MIQKPRGTKDILPQESYKWQYVEEKIKSLFQNYGYKEIRVPVFENTELYSRGVGQTTDVVQKEMYTFLDKGDRSITLRPEGTAGVVRSYIENGMSSISSPVKMWYNMTMYRYESVQKGRYREFRQVGAECIGVESYLADIEMILLGIQIFGVLGIPNIELKINSIGCSKCREEYQTVLKEFIKPNLIKYCSTCVDRFEKNPLRILDCKEKQCKELNKNSPAILDYLCEECKTHFQNLTNTLDTLNIKYEVDANIVRGLDYYTKTVFEFISKEEGYTILAGGRYDRLVKELGGQDTPAVGFASGLDRLLEIYEKYSEKDLIKPNDMTLFVAHIGKQANILAIKLTEELRRCNVYVEKDVLERSLKAQLKYADKKNSKYLIIIGEDELKTNKAKIKNMETGEEKQIDLTAEEILKEIE